MDISDSEQDDQIITFFIDDDTWNAGSTYGVNLN